MTAKKSRSKRASVSQHGAAGASSASSASVVLLLGQMLLCLVGINVCFGWWSVKQERVVKKPYLVNVTVVSESATAAFSSEENTTTGQQQERSMFLSTVYGISFSQALAGFLVSGTLLCVHRLASAVITSIQKLSSTQDKVPVPQGDTGARLTVRDVPEMMAMGFSNIFATSLGYAAMRRLSYPVALTAKMGKMLPVMFVGAVWYHTRYPLKKILSCFLITGGVICFALLEHRGGAASAKSNVSTASATPSSLLGMLMMIVNLLMDGYTNSTQDVLVKRHKWGGVPLMMWTNLVSVLCAMFLFAGLEVGEQLSQWAWLLFEHAVVQVARVLLLFGRPSTQAAVLWLERAIVGRALVNATNGNDSSTASYASIIPFHDFSKFLCFLHDCPEARHDVLLMALLNALGQLFVFHTISAFGTLAVTAMTLLRKAGSVLLSIYVHGHPVRGSQWAALGAVFVGVVGEGYINIVDASRRQRQRSNGVASSAPYSSSSPTEAKSVAALGPQKTDSNNTEEVKTIASPRDEETKNGTSASDLSSHEAVAAAPQPPEASATPQKPTRLRKRREKMEDRHNKTTAASAGRSNGASASVSDTPRAKAGATAGKTSDVADGAPPRANTKKTR